MKIELDIPKWAKGKHIYVFAGRELLVQLDYLIKFIDGKHVGSYDVLKIKPEDGRCTGCGTCCETLGSPFSQQGVIDLLDRLSKYEFSDEGRCPFLGENGCSLGSNIPFSCARSNCQGMENCTEKLIDIGDI